MNLSLKNTNQGLLCFSYNLVTVYWGIQKGHSFLDIKKQGKQEESFIYESKAEMSFIKTVTVKNLATYVTTTLSLHFINFSTFTLSEFMHWKRDITHNNSLLIPKESSCVFKKNIKQLFPDEGSL